MNLNDAQKQTVAQWIADGLKLSEIQKKLASDLGLQLTYIEVRFLVDDLKLVPKDPAPPKVDKPAASPLTTSPASGSNPPLGQEGELPGGDLPPANGKVALTVDTVTRPGALVSGNVTFSDGQSAAWYLDQMGRLGVVAKPQGDKPSAADVQSFQQALEAELSRMGM